MSKLQQLEKLQTEIDRNRLELQRLQSEKRKVPSVIKFHEQLIKKLKAQKAQIEAQTQGNLF